MAPYIDKLAWIDIVDRRILSTRSIGKDTYYIPGGKRDSGETDQEALIREVKEELTIDLVPETIQFFGQFEAQAHDKPEGIMVRMTCYTASYVGEIRPASEVEEVVWFQHRDNDKSSAVDKVIFDWLRDKNMID